MPEDKGLVRKISLADLQLGYSDGRKVDPEETRAFVRELKKMADEFGGGVTPEDFLEIMIRENGYANNTLLLDQYSGAKTNKTGKEDRARGLIQFVGKTAKGIGLDRDELSTMTPTEQLKYVKKFYLNTGVNPRNIKSFEDLYLATFNPASVGKGDKHVIGDKNSTDSSIKDAYDGNYQLDVDGDGIITKGDFMTYIAEKDPISDTSLLTEVTPEQYYKDYEKISTVETTIVESNTEILEGKDKGKYKTTYVTPKGEEETIITNEPVEQKKYGNSVYFKDGSSFYEIDAKTGDLGKKKDINAVYDTEWKDLESMVAKGEHLSQKQLELAENVYQLKQGKLDADLSKAQIDEGLFTNVQSDPVKLKKTKLKEEYFTKILLPEEKSYLKEEYQARKKELADLEESLMDSDATPEQLAERRKSFKVKTEEFKDYKVEANKKWKRYKVLANVGKPVKNLKGETMHIQGLREGVFEEIHKKIDERKPNIPVDSEGFDEIATKTRPDKYPTGGTRKSYVSPEETVVTKPTAGDIDDGEFITDEEIENDEALAEAIDEETLLKRNKMDEETIALLKSQAPGDPVEEEEGVNWNNITGNMMDVGRGLIGISGAMEEVPEYETDPMMQQYLDDAKYRKEEGLTPQEESIMNQQVEKAHAFDVANIRGLAGGSGGTALTNLGRAASTMQEGYQGVAMADAQARRQSRARFDQAAGTAEGLNRQKFQDKFQQVMLNKQEGAALARESFQNMSDRAQYEETYGRDSEYSKLMKAKRGALEESTAASKSSREMTRQEAINSLQEGIDKRKKVIKRGSTIG